MIVLVRTVLVALIVALIVASCGDNLDGGGLQSGSRLRLVEYVGDDGSVITDSHSFYDTQLNTRCEPVVFSDGARYCMPEGAGGDVVFLDAQCSQPVGQLGVSEKMPVLVVRWFALDDERRPSRLYFPGQPIEPPALYWEQQDGFCIGPHVDATGTFLSLGQQVLPSDLVRIREVARVDGDELAAGRDTSIDGFAAYGALYAPDGAPCDRLNAPNGADTACVPREQPDAIYYADDQCAESLVALEAGTVAHTALHYDPRSGCRELVAVGETVEPATIYQVIDGHCVSVPLPVDKRLASTHDPVALPTLMRRVTSSDRRLRSIELVDGPLRIPDPFVHDSVLGADCRFTRTADARYACIPDAQPLVTTVFTNDTCFYQQSLAFIPSGPCALPQPLVLDGESRRPVLEPYDQPFFQLEPGDRCGPYEAPPGTRAYLVGAPIDESEYVHATPRVQP